ncbi:expressed unknown protein [Seminavis robusta]|uniref:Uncharacterized protein n=1 Tax=Seminavis robusta TaxID=568900 RepID=A0A9N8H4Q5_9STRA|nr:expressed unknown protein [Seminavis robusta]|eukprot:Sro69_g038450.1 n/a (228) ;mRNA; r:23552-24235
MKCAPILLAVLALVGRVHAQTHSAAVSFALDENIACTGTEHEDYLNEVASLATDVVFTQGNSGNWRGRGNGNGNKRALAEEEFMEMEEDFLDVMEGAPQGHRRLCDAGCRNGCAVGVSVWCICCTCCNRRRRHLLTNLRLRRLDDVSLGVKAHLAAEKAVKLLEAETLRVEPKVPDCLLQPFYVEVYFEDDSDSSNNGRGIHGEHRNGGTSQGNGNRGQGNGVSGRA